MVRLDLAFFLCCCKAILGPLHRNNQENGELDFYQLLGVQRDASPDDIKRAYKRQSLQMHPDKLAQKGKTVTEQDKAQFTRMKEAYEILSDPHKRETYDAVGERGLKWLSEPFTIDPRELMNNFAASSTLDRSKIFAIFLVIFIFILLLPVLICLQIDQVFGDTTKWSLVLLPLWIWNVFIFFYHIRVIRLGPIPKPEDIPGDQWEDPLPMFKRYLALGSFLCTIFYEVAFVLQLDHVIELPWRIFCVPLLFLEGLNMTEKIGVIYTGIITVEDLEKKLGKPIDSDTLTAKDKAFIKRFFVVPSIGSLEHLVAMGVKRAAKRDSIKIIFRSCFIILVGSKLDGQLNWNWWGIFSPFWILTILTCLGNVHYYTDMSSKLALMEEELLQTEGTKDMEKQDSGPQEQHEKRAEMHAQVALLRKQFIVSCCTQTLFILVLCIFAAKLDGASFSTLWLISPLILLMTILLCIIACAIYCVRSPSNDDDASNWDYHQSDDTMNINNPPIKPIVVTPISRPAITSYPTTEVSATYVSPTLQCKDVIEEPSSISVHSLINVTSKTDAPPIMLQKVNNEADDEEPGIIPTRFKNQLSTFERNSHDLD